MAEFITPIALMWGVWGLLLTAIGYDKWQQTGQKNYACLALIGPVWPLALPVLLVYALYWALRGLAAYVVSLRSIIKTAFDKED